MRKSEEKQKFIESLDKEELISLHKDHSANWLSKYYGVPIRWIHASLKAYNISEHPTKRKTKLSAKKKEFYDKIGKAKLFQLYESYSASYIGRLYSVPYSWVLDALEYYEIPKKSMQEIHCLDSVQEAFKSSIVEKNGNKDLTKILSADELQQAYKEKSATDIALEYGIPRQYVRRALETYEIPKISHYNRAEWKQKSKQTCLDRYGCDNWAKTDAFKTNYYANMNITKAKEFATKKQRGTFNSSSFEDAAYIALVRVYGEDDVVRQYKDTRYPFACDFYIKSLDMFIELNYSWTHGSHPFDEANAEDIAKLSKWQEKARSSRYYQNAITTWTERDTKKLQVAKENNLNYKVLYKYDKNDPIKEIINTGKEVK